jgi:hypothetical protein
MQKSALRFFILPVVLLLAGAAAGQQSSCRVDLPVGIVGTDGSLLEGLTAQDISVHVRKQALPIEAVGSDDGSRRVLFILDTSRWLAPGVRKAETMLVGHVISNARPADTFALLTTRGVVRQVHFEEGREALMKAVQELAADPKEKAKAPNVLDTIMAGIGWFGQPRSGDAIFVMADHLEESNGTSKIQNGYATDIPIKFESSKVKFRTVTEALALHRIRVFGVQFSALKVNEGVFEPSDENLTGITLGSGGYLLLDPTDPFGSYVLDETRTRSLQHKVFQLYGAITRFYVLRVNAPTPLRKQLWNLELAKDLRHNTRALYPRWFDPCSSEDAH